MTTALREPDVGSDAVRPRRWDRVRTRRAAAFGLVVGLGIVLVVLLALSGQRPTQPLDPQGPGPEGAMALAEVLGDQGVEVEVVRSISALEAAAPDRSTTVLMSDPTTLGLGAAERLGRAALTAGRLVVVGGTTDQLDAVGVPASSFDGEAEELPARCDSTVARDDDVASESDSCATSPTRGCRPRPASCSPRVTARAATPCPRGPPGRRCSSCRPRRSTPRRVLVGFGSAWTNQEITQESNAGLAVRALGSTPRLVWYQPGRGDLTAPGVGETRAVADVWPVWTAPAMALVGVAVVLLALARGRRLGRLVREPLPVVVRAVETTESRGRLYRKAGDRDRAAAVLRAGTRDRLARRLAVAPGAAPVALVHAVASTTGRPVEEVGMTLFGPPPADDPSLIRLAQQLTDLEERAHHP